MPKAHILRTDGTVPTGSKRKAWTLCGRVLSASVVMVTDEGATCERCLKYYKKRQEESATAVRLETLIKETPRSQQIAEALVRGKEVRTTSSTGGQKGVKLERHDLIPAGPLRELAVLFGVGARKYDVHQWRRGYEFDKSYAALQRHALLWHAGFDYDVCSNDPEGCQHVDSQGEPFVADLPDACYNHTGAHHLTAVAWHAFVLLEFKDTHPDHDNRYIPNKE
jgi:hypothetical protein